MSDDNIQPIHKRKRKKCYESPLRCIKKSPRDSSLVSPANFKEVRNLLSHNGTRRVTRGMLQNYDKQNAFSSNRELRKRRSRNSVIIINDSDNETSGNDKEDASVSVIECSPTTLPSSSRRKSEKNELLKSLRQNKSRSSGTPLNLSIIESSTQSLCNGENIAPSQTEDDVIELWSSLKNSRSNKECTEYYSDETNKRVNFVIDTRPNMKNLEYLRMEKPAWNRRKLDTYEEFVLSLNNNRKKDKHTNNVDSNMPQSNAQSCEEETKTIVSDEQNNPDSSHKLREIVVDGCNVGMAHSNHQMFSVKGIQLVINYFTIRGHVVKVFLPNYFRKIPQLEKLYKKGIVVFTPSRYVEGRRITPYDDRFILEYATACKGIVISSDQYRDLYREKPEWRDTILNRLLTPTFVGDYIMFPEDPLGKSGPKLERFLRH